MVNSSKAPAVVVGAGLGGLAAAIRLRAMGHRVVVLEAGSSPGGRARSFDRDGYSFDAGPTVITAPYLLHELFELVGRDSRDYFKLVPVDPFYRVLFSEGGHFDYVGDEERLLAQIEDVNPADVDGYRRMVAHSQRIFDVGYTQLADKPFTRLSDMLRIMPQMARLNAYRSVYSLVSKYIKDERLRQVFTFQPLLVGGNPFHTPAIYLLIHWLERKWGVHFAMGGTQSIVRGMVKLLEELDVEVRLDTPVERLEVTGHNVTAVVTADGKRTPAAFAVCNADPSTVYTRLLDAKDRSRHSDKAVLGKRQSMGLFVGYFGAKKTFPDVAHHTIVLGPRYKGLLHDVFEKKTLADDFSLYLHAPTRTDSSLAPAGHESFYVLSPVPNQKSGIDWSKQAPEYLDRVLTHLEARCLPGLKANLTTSFSVDPRYFETELRSMDGAAFGLEPRLTQSAYFRYHNVSEDVGGLYFVGAGTHPGAGVPGVLSSARVLERVVPRGSEAVARELVRPSTIRAAAVEHGLL